MLSTAELSHIIPRFGWSKCMYATDRYEVNHSRFRLRGQVPIGTMVLLVRWINTLLANGADPSDLKSCRLNESSQLRVVTNTLQALGCSIRSRNMWFTDSFASLSLKYPGA